MYPGKGCIQLPASVKIVLGSYITTMKSLCEVAIFLSDRINHFLELRKSFIAMVDFSIIITSYDYAWKFKSLYKITFFSLGQVVKSFFLGLQISLIVLIAILLEFCLLR